MKGLHNPLWVVATQLLPALLGFLLLGHLFQRIDSELSPESLAVWRTFGGLYLLYTLAHGAAALYSYRHRRPLPLVYAVLTVVVGTSLYVAHLFYGNVLVPWSLPRWLMPGDAELVMGAFVLPGIMYALLLVVAASLPEGAMPKAGKSLLTAGFMVLMVFLLVMVGFPGFLDEVFDLGPVLLAVLIAAATLLFCIALLRAAYIFWLRRQFQYNRALYYGLVALAGGMVGLYVNHEFDYLVGDFSHPSWYLLVILHGVLWILFPTAFQGKPLAGAVLLVVRVLFLPCLVYFALVLLPYVPFAPLGLIAFGSGLLVFVPYFLLIPQLSVVGEEYRRLRQHVAAWPLVVLIAVGLLILPGTLLSYYTYHRHVLAQALEEFHQPPLLGEPLVSQVNASALKEVFTTTEGMQTTRGSAFLGTQAHFQPYLSLLYQLWVFDGLSLSDQKREQMHRWHFGESAGTSRWQTRWWNPGQAVEAGYPEVQTQWDAEAEAWRTWVHVRLTTEETREQEWATRFELPEGVFISNSYLDLPDRREFGVLVDRRAATWVYQQVTRRAVPQDPALVRHIRQNTWEWRVFPVRKNVARTAGIELLHGEPFTLTLGSDSLAIGGPAMGRPTAGRATPQPRVWSSDQVAYWSASAKEQLSLVTRQPYYHFVLSGGQAAAGMAEEQAQAVQQFLKIYPLPGAAAPRFSLAGSSLSEGLWESDWAMAHQAHPYQGGFTIGYALARLLAQQWQQPTGQYPIPVVIDLTDAFRVWDDRAEELAFALPELSGPLLWLADSGTVEPRSWSGMRVRDEPRLAPRPVRQAFSAAGQVAFLPNNQQASLVVWPQAGALQPQPEAALWERGLIMAGLHRLTLLGLRPGHEAWRTLLAESYATALAIPPTAYIMVETEAQREALLAAQAKVRNLDDRYDLANEDQMPEPGFYLLLAFAALLGWRFRARLSRFGVRS